MARLGRYGFLAIGVVFHLVYIYSIFDIYFVSPIVGGMRAYRVDAAKAPAQRLVLYVGDGLRADKAFQSFPDPSPAHNDSSAQVPRPLTPFLRSRVLEHGTFGVSHTRVPTESRPGHVALIAGLYEDVAAVTTGWKLNPVNFDSVFNRSRHTWSWGSPDILPMFSLGAVPGRVEDATYAAEDEDFSKDATELDFWVFDRVKQLFKDAEHNATLNAQLRKDKVVFFLHLLGIDTTGHFHRPYSREYLHNIKIVDQGVREITQIIDDFYEDNETAYIFTADHGMSDWGSHGDGHPDNTRTPLIAWGAGVAKPVKVAAGKAPGHEDGFSSDWGLDQIQRHDVAQADVAALMAYLAGLEFPVNSVGELPLSFLDASDEQKARALLVNLKEILEIYRVKEAQKRAVVFNYKPYPGFSGMGKTIDDRLAAIETMVTDGHFQDAITSSNDLIQKALAGLRYLQTYNWLFLRTLVTAGYLGWIAFSLTTAIDGYVLGGRKAAARTPATITGSASIFVGLLGFLYAQSSPFTYYLYVIFPIVFWEEVFSHRHVIFAGVRQLSADLSTKGKMMFPLTAIAYLAILEVMVQSYYRREIYTVCYIAAILWPFLYGWDFVNENKSSCAIWSIACAAMSVFTLLPANKVEDVTLIMYAGLLIGALGIVHILYRLYVSAPPNSSIGHAANTNVSVRVSAVQIGLVLASVVVTKLTVASLQARQGLPAVLQILGWMVFLASLGMPFLFPSNSDWLSRFVAIFLTFGPTFVILTVSYEGLFFVAITLTLFIWVHLESRLHQRSTGNSKRPVVPSTSQRDRTLEGQYRPLVLSDARISLFFLFLLQSAFYSTGNIASISTFSLEAVSRLIPVFDPFSQGALLMFKILAPFVMVSTSLGLLTRRLRLRSGSLFAVVMAISDYLTLRFFWEVRDEGSWLEIGESISMFVIASLFCVFVAGLENLSGPLLKGVELADAAARESKTNGTPDKRKGPTMTARKSQ